MFLKSAILRVTRTKSSTRAVAAITASGSLIFLCLHIAIVRWTISGLKGWITDLATKLLSIASFSGISLNRRISIWEITEILGIRSTMPEMVFMPKSGSLPAKYPMTTSVSRRYCGSIRYGLPLRSFAMPHTQHRKAARLRQTALKAALCTIYRSARFPAVLCVAKIRQNQAPRRSIPAGAHQSLLIIQLVGSWINLLSYKRNIVNSISKGGHI